MVVRNAKLGGIDAASNTKTLAADWNDTMNSIVEYIESVSSTEHQYASGQNMLTNTSIKRIPLPLHSDMWLTETNISFASNTAYNTANGAYELISENILLPQPSSKIALISEIENSQFSVGASSTQTNVNSTTTNTAISDILSYGGISFNFYINVRVTGSSASASMMLSDGVTNTGIYTVSTTGDKGIGVNGTGLIFFNSDKSKIFIKLDGIYSEDAGISIPVSYVNQLTTLLASSYGPTININASVTTGTTSLSYAHCNIYNVCILKSEDILDYTTIEISTDNGSSYTPIVGIGRYTTVSSTNAVKIKISGTATDDRKFVMKNLLLVPQY